MSFRRAAVITVASLAALATLVLGQATRPAHAAGQLMGVPTVVDPIRAAGEPDLSAGLHKNTVITAPAGSGAQTSWFWRTFDDGLSYRNLGPSTGHWVCPASGGGDSLATRDPVTGDQYVVDQESLASLGLGKLTESNQLTAGCANAPAASADRPFFALLPTGNRTAPQSVADSGKPINYLSWQCSGCGAVGSQGNNVGGLGFAWTDDGVTYHVADPGASPDNLAGSQFDEGNAICCYAWHGSMVVDPTTGIVFTAIGCSVSNGCPNNAGRDETGIAVGVPQKAPSGNIGQFASLTYQTVAVMPEAGTLFPTLGMDSQHTLYEEWTQGDGFASTGAPADAQSWHIFYAYSLDSASDNHMHTRWSQPIQVDAPPTQAAVFGWMTVGDPGHLGFLWLGSPKREHPSTIDTSNIWYPYVAVTTDGNTGGDGVHPNPTFIQSQVSQNPNHLGDICLQGTVGCIENAETTAGGNRNMADFIAADIGPDGALQVTWAADANQLATLPTTKLPGAPVVMTARQVSGPRLIGSGDVGDTRFDPTPTMAGVTDVTGDATYPLPDQNGNTAAGANQANLDLTASRIEYDGSNLLVHISAADLSTLASPDATQKNVWWLTTWVFDNHIYFAKAEVNAAGVVSYTAGAPASFDRAALTPGQTVATLVDYSGGTTVQGVQKGNEFVITVPASISGTPTAGSILESVTGFSVLDNGAPPAVGPGAANNVPTVVDATPAYDAALTSPAANTPETPLTALLVLGGCGMLAAAAAARRRRAPALP